MVFELSNLKYKNTIYNGEVGEPGLIHQLGKLAYNFVSQVRILSSPPKSLIK